jgi:c-di-GMP-binding flagellar brake protein YcgR
MEERRKFNRWRAETAERAAITYAGTKEEAEILDISAGGMRVFFPRFVDIGAVIYGEFKILPGRGPFFVRGKVIRAAEREGKWDLGIEFEKVSTLPLQA